MYLSKVGVSRPLLQQNNCMDRTICYQDVHFCNWLTACHSLFHVFTSTSLFDYLSLSLSLSFKVNFNLHESLFLFCCFYFHRFRFIFSYSFLFHILSFRHFESTTGMLSSHFFSFPYRLITLPYLNSLMSVDWKQTKKNIQTNGDIVIDVSRLSRR